MVPQKNAGPERVKWIPRISVMLLAGVQTFIHDRNTKGKQKKMSIMSSDGSGYLGNIWIQFFGDKNSDRYLGTWQIGSGLNLLKKKKKKKISWWNLSCGSGSGFLTAKCSTKNHSGSLSVCLMPLAFFCHLLENSSGNPYLKICDLT